MKPFDPPICHYCGKDSKLVTGEAIYPHRKDLYHLNFYLCSDCNAYVGTHKGTLKPLGRLANAELRQAKVDAHAAFDPLWKGNRFARRKDAYSWLAKQLGIPRYACHIGEFDVATCVHVIEVCSK